MTDSVNILLVADEVARLTGLSVRTIRHNCAALKYPAATKGADGWIIPLTSLPEAAQARYCAAQPPDPSTTLPIILPAVTSPPSVIDSDALYLAFRQAPPKSKARATKLYEAVTAFEDLRAAGESKGRAAAYVKDNHQVDAITLWRVREAVKGQPQQLWEALLLPRYIRTHARS